MAIKYDDKIKLAASVLTIAISFASIIYTTVYNPLSCNIKEANAEIACERNERLRDDKEIRSEIGGKLDSILDQTGEIRERVSRIEGRLDK